MRVRLILLVLLLVPSAALPTPVRPTPTGQIRISGAFFGGDTAKIYEEEDGSVLFEPFDEIDFKALAPDWLRTLDPDNPDPGSLKRLEAIKSEPKGGGNEQSVVAYEAALGASSPKGFYYLISSNGVTQLALSKLKCLATAYWDGAPGSRQFQMAFGGLVAAKAENQAMAASGFVLLSSQRIDFQTLRLNQPGGDRITAWHQGEAIICRYSVRDRRPVRLQPERWDHSARITRALSIKSESLSCNLVLVQWAKDTDGCCAYSLFQAFGHCLEPESFDSWANR